MAKKILETNNINGKSHINENCPQVHQSSVVTGHGVSSADMISLQDVATEKVEIISQKMHRLPDEFLQQLKKNLRVILVGYSVPQNLEEFFHLHRLVHTRSDLDAKTLAHAHKVQLEILVAISTGIFAFLHPNISLSQTALVEVFVHKRCRNLTCQSQLPANDCTCGVCTQRKGFCNVCMCVACNKFDFQANTCRWIGCNPCSHWTHFDCAIRDGNIRMGPSEMLFVCRACSQASELLGWVKGVFQHCASAWEPDVLLRELDFVSRIFHASEDQRGQKLFCKCEDLKEKLKRGGIMHSKAASRDILMFFRELEQESPKRLENGEGGGAIAVAFNQIEVVLQDVLRKMEMVCDEKKRMYEKARLAVQDCDIEFLDNAKEVAELKRDMQERKLEIEELVKGARLKHAEADRFQLMSNEANREAEKHYLLFEKIKLQESTSSRTSQGESCGAERSGEDFDMLMYPKTHINLLNNGHPKAESLANEGQPFMKFL
ncbi:Protein OBERON [Parasponia andersonii]|uniref:Protein OBERON n=1 Tax=Parasponia andersonii TaxID=3476 RepID=A0A2P5C188_PARAD|nr:Protein OBERON [Parasponia andersonii]